MKRPVKHFTIFLLVPFITGCSGETKEENKEKPDKSISWRNKKENFELDNHSFIKENNGNIEVRLKNKDKTLKIPKDRTKEGDYGNKLKETNEVILYLDKSEHLVLRNMVGVPNTDNVSSHYKFISAKSGNSFKAPLVGKDPIISPDSSKILFIDPLETEGPGSDRKGGFYVVSFGEKGSSYLKAKKISSRVGSIKGEWAGPNSFEVHFAENESDNLATVQKFSLAGYGKGTPIEDGTKIP